MTSIAIVERSAAWFFRRQREGDGARQAVEGDVLYGASACIFYELLTKLSLTLTLDLPPFHFEDQPP